MCGRYTLYTDDDERELAELLDIMRRRSDEFGENCKTGEIFPSDVVPVLVRGKSGGMNLAPIRWGFQIRDSLIINARRETVATKPSFRSSFTNGRCVIPSTGFFEWDKSKKKYLFNLPNTRMVYMAGIMRETSDSREFTIITAEANASVSPIHNRMPLILPRINLRDWLYNDDLARTLCGEYPLPELSSIIVA